MLLKIKRFLMPKNFCTGDSGSSILTPNSKVKIKSPPSNKPRLSATVAGRSAAVLQDDVIMPVKEARAATGVQPGQEATSTARAIAKKARLLPFTGALMMNSFYYLIKNFTQCVHRNSLREY